jgi:hypothetical protein
VAGPSNRENVETLTVLGAVVSALAAMGALYFAFETVEQAKGARREDRLARIADLIGEVGALTYQLKQGAHSDLRPALAVARLRLLAALDASGETLPTCEELLDTDYLANSVPVGTLEAGVERALTEIKQAIVAVREVPSTSSTSIARA